MTNTNKFLIALGILAVIIILFNWKKIFGEKSDTTVNSGTGTNGIKRTMPKRIINLSAKCTTDADCKGVGEQCFATNPPGGLCM